MTTLLLVHAHPDDEAISTGGVMCMAKDQGRRVVLVTSTRGEEGEIHNMDEATSRPRLGEIRTEELRRACEVLGVDRQEFLGYRDSGMAGTPANEDPRSYHSASLEEAASRLVKIMEEERPEVVVTYSADGTYGHPDHIKAHQVTMAAVDRLLAEGKGPRKVYLHSIPLEMMNAFREMMKDQDPEGANQEMADRLLGVPEARITTYVDVKRYIEKKRQAFQAHVSQNSPQSPFATMAGQIFEMAFGTEAFELVRGELGAPRPEPDLFAGIPV